MIEKYLLVPDPHNTERTLHKPYVRVKDFALEWRPDETILMGDFMNMDSLAHWNDSKSKKLEMEGRRFKKEVEVCNKELDYWQEVSKRVTYIEGNHEEWVAQYIGKHPETEGLIELPNVLHLNERGIKWVRLNRLYKVGKLYLTHGAYATKYHAMAHLLKYGCCLCYGHTHTAQIAQINMKMQEALMAWGLGCLCDHEPSYMKGKPANWINQFAVLYVNTKNGRFNLYPINIIKGKFIWEGKEWGF
jgi:predicted phosphodiesterase